MKDNISDIPSAYPLLNTQHDNARTLVAVLTIMAFLASLALIFALSAQRLKTNWQNELGSNATIQIMIENSEIRNLKTDAAMVLLKAEFPKATIKTCLLYTSDAADE